MLDPEIDAALKDGLHRYFAERRARIPAFARERFGFRGTIRLHKAAIGLDLLRAPVNVALAPIYVGFRVASPILRWLGLTGAAQWLASRQIFLRTRMADVVARSILSDLLELHGDARGADALSKRVLSEPMLELLSRQSPASKIGRSLDEYTTTRAAVSEMTTALGTLTTGALVFHTITPGMLSAAPAVAIAVTQSAAIAAFPLGGTAGAIWYGLFPADVAAPVMVSAIATMVVLGSLITAFAGLIADPLQVALGIHQRRLRRLVDRMETELCGRSTQSSLAREHLMARLLDLADAGIGALSALRP